MKNKFLLLVALAFITACTGNKYPVARTVDTVTNYFGTKVADPYRWLENDTTQEVKQWVDNETAYTNKYLNQIPFRDKLKDRITQIYNYTKYSGGFKNGDNVFFEYNNGLMNQSQIMIQKGLDGQPSVFLDPNTLSSSGTATISIDGFSKDHHYAAYHVNRAGSDWETTYVVEVTTGKNTGDSLQWLKFGGAAWQGNGFYYSGYEAPKNGNAFLAKNVFQKVYYHNLGDPQSKDKLIYQDSLHPQRYISAATTEDECYLLISIAESDDGNELWYKDLSKNEDVFHQVFPGFSKNYNVLDNIGDKFLVQTNAGADNYQVVLVDPKNPDKANWKVIVPEKPERESFCTTAGRKLFVGYLKDAITHVYQYSYDGTLDHEIDMPGLGTAGGFGGYHDDKYVFYDYTSFTVPNTIYKYDIATGKSDIFKKSKVSINMDDYVTEQVFYTSKDGAKIPMFLTHKKGIKLDGSHPTLLYGYGGFDISITPSFVFSSSQICYQVLLENDGVFAVANLRGGGEYGQKWHDAGRLLNKQNVFDDFIAAAEYLKNNKYTTTDKLAIMGRSNGGLLIGAVETQRPDLCAVCFPGEGVLDMLRFQKFTVGWGWVSDYGSSDSAKYFKYLYSYSPYHNIKDGTSYPATMITTADHDDRVVPGHSFKFAARMQQAQKGDAPILIRIDKQAGHGAGKPLSKIIDEQTDTWAFLFYNMNITPQFPGGQQ